MERIERLLVAFEAYVPENGKETLVNHAVAAAAKAEMEYVQVVQRM